eukprot:12355911-Ditylum_brightwellii.AAC.1
MAVCRALNWDILQPLCWEGGVASVDASNCYNRVVHNTGHGDSDLSYSVTHGDPFQGLCQGNGAAPGLW